MTLRLGVGICDANLGVSGLVTDHTHTNLGHMAECLQYICLHLWDSHRGDDVSTPLTDRVAKALGVGFPLGTKSLGHGITFLCHSADRSADCGALQSCVAHQLRPAIGRLGIGP